MNNQSNIYYKKFAFLLISFLLLNTLQAHEVEGLAKLSKTEVASIYLQLGFSHIIPLGLDHIVFVVSLCLLNTSIKSILLQATAFTIAHTITLALTMYSVIKPPANIVEPFIALTIGYVAVENIFSKKLKTSRIGVVFVFGLIHGMGFASALNELGLPKDAFFSSLIMFNIGVELGQVVVIVAIYLLIVKLFGKKTYYRNRVVIPISIIIALIASYWVIERVFL